MAGSLPSLLTGAVLKIQPHHDMDRDIAGQLVELATKLTASIRDNIKSYSETEKAYFLRAQMKEWEIVVVLGEYGWSLLHPYSPGMTIVVTI